MYLKSWVTHVPKSLSINLNRTNLIVLRRAVVITVLGSKEELTLTSKCINKFNTSNLKFNHRKDRLTQWLHLKIPYSLQLILSLLIMLVLTKKTNNSVQSNRNLALSLVIVVKDLNTTVLQGNHRDQL